MSFIAMAIPHFDGAKAFYGSLFGWTFGNEYPNTAGRLCGAGIPGNAHASDQRCGFVIYFRTRDLAAAAARVQALGGTVGPVVPLPGAGKLQLCRDNQDVEFGLHQPEG
ncbi:hypothetical protein [Pseudorhodoplanes sp.]|uniref:hypothetical protein n=1 Tax=Pseudorhodoplanes sp. TaxID=1934341 RepID=UPI00391887DA